MTKARICSVDGCGKTHKAKGLCQKHYMRLRTHGCSSTLKKPPNGELLKFLEWVIQQDTDDCILWPYGKTHFGYGVAQFEGKRQNAHAVALKMAVGPPPFEGAMALHEPVNCHNPSCVNPKHLRWGSGSDNFDDKVLDGTSNRGEQNWDAKLTEDDVRLIRKTKESAPKLAEKFNVTVWTIYDVRKRRSWAWLED